MSRRRIAGVVAGLATLVVVSVAVAIGGGSGSGTHGSSSGTSSGASSSVPSGSTRSSGGASATSGGSAPQAGGRRAKAAAAHPAPTSTSTGAQHGDAAGAGEAVAFDTTATRVVRTGSVDLRVPRGGVPATLDRLAAAATGDGGDVERRHSDTGDGPPFATTQLKVPTAAFDTLVRQVQKLGRVESLSTSASDVTGRYVDLQARKVALERGRSTYLTILGHATTIASTLEVQQRVDDVQEQLERLQGQIKVLQRQTADATLTVTLAEVGSPTPSSGHHDSGLGAAWHRSVRRFTTGIDGIVGVLGPLALALLLTAVVVLAASAGYRRVRRVSG